MDIESFWIILSAALAAINCGLIGCYLILRRAAMMGDAISHAVLPGLVAAVLLTGSKTSLVILVGAGSLGILATMLIEALQKTARVQLDAAIGINFTWLFALGVILISFFSHKVDLDPDCILYGEIAYIPLDLWITSGGTNLGPRSIYVLATMLVFNLLLIFLNYKELQVTTFDPAFANTTGINAALWHYLLMGATSFTTVATFEAAGAILVVALLVTPPATAYLLTRRLSHMLLLATLLGILSAVGGYYLAIWVNGAIAGAMATVAGSIFLVVLTLQCLLYPSGK